MAARFARGRFGAACVVGLLAWLAAAGTAVVVRAQEFVDDWPIVDESAAGSWEEFGRGGGWGADCDSCACGDACCDGSYAQDCGCCFPCNSTQRWWFGAELLLWRIPGQHLPPLVTQSPFGTNPVLNATTTQVVAGDNIAGSGWRTGYELELGVWFDDCQELALVGDYFNVGQDDYDFYYPGNEGFTTGRPYLNVLNGQQDAWIISGPSVPDASVYDGTISVTADDDFQGAGLAIQQRVYGVGDLGGYGPSTQVMVIGGYRFFSYDSQLLIRDSRIGLSGTNDGDQVFRRDQFNTDNEFHGGEIGVMARFTQTGCWFDGLAKLAIGGHSKRATIDGHTTLIDSGVVEQEEGGLLTSGETNIGTYKDSRVRFIPTFRLGVGAYLTPQWSFKAGYSVIVWGGVARAAGITPPNLAVDRRNIPYVPPSAGSGGPAPVFPGIGGSELVAHGLDLGFEYRY